MSSHGSESKYLNVWFVTQSCDSSLCFSKSCLGLGRLTAQRTNTEEDTHSSTGQERSNLMACIQRRTSIVKLKVRDILELLIYIVCNLYSKSKTRHVFVVISINAVFSPPTVRRAVGGK